MSNVTPQDDLDWWAALNPAVAQPLPGTEMGYAERWTSATSVQAGDTDANLNANLIAGLSVPVVGEGRPVEVELYHPLVAHTVVNGTCYATIMVNGTRLATAPMVLPKAGAGSMVICKKRLVLAQDVAYTFTAAMTIDTAGTGTWYADELLDMAMHLVVIRR